MKAKERMSFEGLYYKKIYENFDSV